MEALLRSKTSVDPVDTEDINQKAVEKTIKNWIEIQRLVKMEQSLEDMINEQHEDHGNKLDMKVKELFNAKLKTRKLYDDIKYLKLNTEGSALQDRPLEYYIEEKNDNIIGQATESITKLFFIIRKYFDYIPKIVSLIDENEKREKIESIAELFCNQFYDNVLIPNPEQEELLICIFKLLEFEINKMESSNIERFLNDSSFIGTFMTVFSKQHDLSVYIGDLLDNVMYKVKNKNEKCLDISFNGILKYLIKEKKNDEKEKAAKKEKEEKKKEKEEKKKEDDEREKRERKEQKEKKIKELFDIIPKSEIYFPKNLQLGEELERKKKKIIEKVIKEEDEDVDDKPKNEIIEEKNEIKETKKEKENYEDDLTDEYLNEKLKKIKNEDLKAFYNYVLNQIVDDPNTFCKDKIFDVLMDDEYDEYYEEMINIYKNNIKFIQERVESLIQTLINKLPGIPYIVRCICKIIDILISHKFPSLPKYMRHSYIGKFFFNKCIFPVLSLENKAILKKVIFTPAQKKCFNLIINIISSANQCSLFNHYNDIEKVLLNKYILDIVPVLNKFFDKVIDLTLPRQLNECIMQSFENKVKKGFCFNRKELPKDNKIKKYTSYDYFGENIDEILRLKTICFTVEDILYIKDLISFNESQFKDFPEFESLKKAVDEIEKNEYKIPEARQKFERKDCKSFLLISQLDKIPELDEFLSRKKTKKKDKPILWRIKDSIKIILKGLNLLNIKDYSDLSKATNNENFFTAIDNILKDIGEDNGIPLNWYSNYIIKNKSKIDPSYLENDFKKLYDEILDEERNLLNEMKKMSSKINAREGMNLQCAKRIVEKAKYDEKCLEQTKKFQKIETFIEKDRTKVCIKVNEKIEKDEDKNNKKDNEALAKIKGLKGLVIKTEKISSQYIEVVDADKCEHKSESFIQSTEGQKNKNISTHANTVNMFINKFKNPKTSSPKLQILLKYINEDIESGEPNHELYKAFRDYKNLLKESIIKNDKELIESKEKGHQEMELKEILDRIEDHIMLKIYKYVFPIEPSENLKKKDYDFYKYTYLYCWIEPNYLGVKVPVSKDEIETAIKCLLQFEETAQTITEKLNCIKEVYSNINKAILFNTGKKEELSAEDQTPLLFYIILQSHPKHYISNIHYIKCFFDQGRQDKVFLTNITEAADGIINMNAESFKIDKNEFNEKVEKAKREFEEMEKNKK